MEVSDSKNDSNSDLYTIPSYSSWFSWSSIHEIERISLPEFFDGSSITRSPRIYKEYRDFIISKFREDPTRTRMTFTEVRKSLVGDVNLIRKVFVFLEKWGLINFSSGGEDDANSIAKESNCEVRVEEGAPTGVRVVAGPNSMKAITPPPPVVLEISGGGVGGESGTKFPPLSSYTNLFEGVMDQKQGKTCRSCKDWCHSKYYELIKDEEYTLCKKCYDKSNYGEDKKIYHFKFVGYKNQEVIWTQAETLLLLESILKHGDDWDLVAESIKTKTKHDCIHKLLQLPFGDFLLGSSFTKNRSSATNRDVSNLEEVRTTSIETPEIVNIVDDDENQDKKTEVSGHDNASQDEKIANVGSDNKQQDVEMEDVGHDVKNPNENPADDKNLDENTEYPNENPDGDKNLDGNTENPNENMDGDKNLDGNTENPDGDKNLDGNTENPNENTDGDKNLDGNTENPDGDKNLDGNTENPNENTDGDKTLDENIENPNENPDVDKNVDEKTENLNQDEKNIENPNQDEKIIENPNQDDKEMETADKEDEEMVNAEEQEGPPHKRQRTMPLYDASSSLMSQVARLASVVGPHITAAAAEAAIGELCNENGCTRDFLDDDNFDAEEIEASSSPLTNEPKIINESENGDGLQSSMVPEHEDTKVERNVVSLTLRMRAATATALGAAAAHAMQLADQEERDIEHLFATVLETQLKKLETKTKYLKSMEEIFEKQHDQMEEFKGFMISERINALQEIFRPPSLQPQSNNTNVV